MPAYTSPSGDPIRGGRGAAPTPEPTEPPTDPPTDAPTDPPPAPGDNTLGWSYVGAVRVRKGTYGDSRSTFSTPPFYVDTTPGEEKIYLSGHPYDDAIGTFTFPTPVDTEVITSMPLCDNIDPFVFQVPDPTQIFAGGTAGDGNHQFTGMRRIGNLLHISVNNFYDNNNDSVKANHCTAQHDDLTVQAGFYKLSRADYFAGWISPVPSAWRTALGGKDWLLGYANNDSINSRFSIGPSLATWDGNVNNLDALTEHLYYPLGSSPFPTGSTGDGVPADPIWNELCEAAVGYIDGDDYVVIGRSGGLVSGIGYKIDGAAGYTSYDPDDKYNYYWRYRLSDILNATNPWDPIPYEYGELGLFTGGPHDDSAREETLVSCGVIGDDGRLYLRNNADAAQSQYETAPVIYVYEKA